MISRREGRDTLLHTDYAPDNILIHGSHAWLIDWAWPALGAAFIDPCCLIVRLVFAGHTPAQAESCVAGTAAWQAAPANAVDVFAGGLATMWTEIADADPAPWQQQMAASARAWLSHQQAMTDRAPGPVPRTHPRRVVRHSVEVTDGSEKGGREGRRLVACSCP